MADVDNPWTTESTRQVYESNLLRLEHNIVRHSSGDPGTYTAIRYKVCGVRILPIDRSGFTYLVGQFRYVPDHFTWELVGGAGDVSDPLQSAQRELKEEIGLTGEGWLECFRLLPSAGLSDEHVSCFVAWQLSDGPADPDPQENITRRKLSFRDAITECLTGEIRDAASVATILALYTRARQRTLPSELQNSVRPHIL